jgi:hypothetical protein
MTDPERIRAFARAVVAAAREHGVTQFIVMFTDDPEPRSSAALLDASRAHWDSFGNKLTLQLPAHQEEIDAA